MAIERGEFQAAVEQIREDIRGVHTRLDALNGRTRKTESDIAVLQERSGGTWLGAVAGGFTGGFTAVGAWALEKLWK